MSSAINLVFDEDVQIQAWSDFCERHGIVYSPNKVGRNVFCQGKVEISTEEEGTVQKRRGRYDWSTALPPLWISGMRVSSFHGSNLESIGELARNIAAAFPCRASCDPELSHTIVDLDQYYMPGEQFEHELGEILGTDLADYWHECADGIEANVEAGHAIIRQTGEDEKFTLHVDGVHRATFRDSATAMCYAGRADWTWWGGPMPGEALEAPVAALPSP